MPTFEMPTEIVWPGIDFWNDHMVKCVRKNIIPRNLTEEDVEYLRVLRREVYFQGCIGLTTCVVGAGNYYDIEGTKRALPPLDNCYKSLADAQKIQKEWNDQGKCGCKDGESGLLGETKARIFAIQYSVENKTDKHGEEPKPVDGNRYDLGDYAYDIVIENQQGMIPFDFLLCSEKTDPWYNEHYLWLHANTGGSAMVVKLSDNEVFERQRGNAHGFGDPFYCVACEKAYQVRGE